MALNFVNVAIHSNVSEFPTEKRFDSKVKVSELKKKLELITGAVHTSMEVTLFIDDQEVGVLINDEETLGHYLGNAEGKAVKLVVKDELPSSTATQEVPKFVISEEKYSQRPNNARDFIRKMRASTGSNK